jgi:hypothetical protein
MLSMMNDTYGIRYGALSSIIPLHETLADIVLSGLFTITHYILYLQIQ